MFVVSIAAINGALLKLQRRAEGLDRDRLVSSFQDVGPLLTVLSTRDHQILYGRRGTGKTHTLEYLSEQIEATGDLACFIDLRTIGSSGGLYSDPQRPISERGTRLLTDALEQVQNRLYEACVELGEAHDLSETGPILDRFIQEMAHVEVLGEVELEKTDRESGRTSHTSGVVFGASTGGGPSAGVQDASVYETASSGERRILRSGRERFTIRFGALGRTLAELLEALGGRRLWLLLDEWSSLPIAMQPVLAEFIKRSLLPLRSVTVKIAAIEQRTHLRIVTDDGHHVGLELGADIAADVNLDDLMVFDNDPDQSRAFFRGFLFKHVGSLETSDQEGIPNTADDFIREAFTQVTAFEEFIRAAEGVPRDAINILSLAARKAIGEPISVPQIRAAARDWYEMDKRGAIRSNPEANEMLAWIIDEVIGDRRARAFLLRADVKDAVIDDLFDARLLHVLKRNISSHDDPGTRYNVYKLDYGCYVDLINTSKATQGLLPFGGAVEDSSAYVDVPPDDYRSIRRAILDVNHFYRARERTRTDDRVRDQR